MMEMFLLVSLAVGATCISVLLSCLRCKRRLTDDEKHTKYFEIFRRSHIRKRTTMANRVDYVRTVITSEPVSSDGSSSLGYGSEHTYEDLRTPESPSLPVIQVTVASPCTTTSEHSFFDDSFQTVIEASSIAVPDGDRRLSGLAESSDGNRRLSGIAVTDGNCRLSDIGVSSDGNRRLSGIAVTDGNRRLSDIGVSSDGNHRLSGIAVTDGNRRLSDIGVSSDGNRRLSDNGVSSDGNRRLSGIGVSSDGNRRLSDIGVSSDGNRRLSGIGVSSDGNRRLSGIGVSSDGNRRLSDIGVSSDGNRRLSGIGVSSDGNRRLSGIGVSSDGNRRLSGIGVSSDGNRRLSGIGVSSDGNRRLSGIAVTDGSRRLSGLLGGTCANIPTYLDLQKPLQDAASMLLTSNLGEDNVGFSISMDNSNQFECNRRRSSCSGTGSYNIPVCDPGIEVVHPRRNIDTPTWNPDTHSLYDIPIHSPDDNLLDRINDLGKLRHCSTKCSTNITGEINQSCEVNNLENGREIDSNKGKEFSNENESIYEKLKISETRDYIYKTLHGTALVLPARPRALSPIMSPGLISYATPSCQSEHTYESITSDLIEEIGRRKWETKSVETDRKQKMFNKILDTPASYSNDLGSINNSGHRTYESLKTPQTSNREEPQCVNSAVIIGRRVSNPFEKNKVAKRMINKKKLAGHNHSNQMHKNSLINTSDGEPRYSPFPSAKKLAFKSAFKQSALPRMCPIPTVAGKLFDNSISKTEMSLNNLNTKTPEIKVENSAKCFNNTAYLSPFCLTKNILTDIESESPSIVTPVCTYETLKNCANLKVCSTNLDTDTIKKQAHYRKSIGSVTESLENEIIEHCNMNIYAMSTPCEPPSQMCDYF